jgi:hypothetical protein
MSIRGSSDMRAAVVTVLAAPIRLLVSQHLTQQFSQDHRPLRVREMGFQPLRGVP